jgi:protoporphyrinogen oxidase
MVARLAWYPEAARMSTPAVVVLGGGLSGMAAAYGLARAGWRDVTIIEHGDELGGLAGSFERQGHCYPLAYHHILHRDRTLLYFLDGIGALPAVRWRKARMLFHVGGKLYDLGSPAGFLSFPMSLPDKLFFVRLMLRSFRKSDWKDWQERSASELLDAWGSKGVREALFEPLCRLKFNLSCDETSAAWLGSRLYFREGSAPFGYIPGDNWTAVLCRGLARRLEEQGVQVRLRTAVRGLSGANGRLDEIRLDGGESLRAEVLISSLPTTVYSAMAPADQTPGLDGIRYTAVISAICATRQIVEPDFYWMNLTSGETNASGLFRLSSLNPTIGGPGESCLNFVNHVQSAQDEYFQRSDDELMAGYLDDFRQVFGFNLDPLWSKISRIPRYSPIFVRGYRNPPLVSPTYRNLYFAGNYRTFPSIASTGTALRSGIEAAQEILRERGAESDLPGLVDAFRLRSMPRATR